MYTNTCMHREKEREQQTLTQKQPCTQVREHAHLPGTPPPHSGCRAGPDALCLSTLLITAPSPTIASASIAQLVRARA